MKKSLARSALLLCTVFGIVSCSHSGTHTSKKIDSVRFLQEHQLTNLPRSEVPTVINDRVIAWMNYFQGPGRGHFQRYMERSGKYHDTMFKIFLEEGVPTDLFYLSMIESGFNVQAVSHASAVGPWQFIKGTGLRYGLTINAWEDERRHVIKSTYAAVQYLQDLYREFGDWYLAFAAYNAGEGRIRRAIKQSGTKDFWRIASSRHYLHSETRDYVPKFLAAMIMAKNPEKFGFGKVEYQSPDEYDVVTVPTQTDFSVLAKCSGVDEETIRQLNPQLIAYATPMHKSGYEVRIPKGAQEQFVVAYNEVPEKDRLTLVYHTIRKGDTLAKIAAHYGVGVSSLAKLNGMTVGRKLMRGRQVLIPIGSAGLARLAEIEKQEALQAKSGGKSLTHKVRPGETLGRIAQRYRVSVAQLRSWNKLSASGMIRVGQKLRINGRSASTAPGASRNVESNKSASLGAQASHVLKNGETLGQVASQYGVKVADLMQWNNIRDARRVRVGQRLVLFGGQALPENSNTELGVTGDGSSAHQDAPVAPASILTTPKLQPNGVYTVRSGDTLSTIARRYNMRTSELVAINGLSTRSNLKIGQKLKVVGGQGNQVAVANDQSLAKADDTEAYRQYRVRAGDSLWEIARRNGVAVNQLKTWNGLGANHQLKAGSYLKIKKI